MQSFKWSKAHEIFIPQLDAEHRNIFRSADELQRAILADAGAERLLESLRALAGCVEDHFVHEERLMRAAAYPSLAWHVRQHDTARKKVTEVLQRIENGHAEAAGDLIEFLSGWLKDHTGLSDRMMASHLRNCERVRAIAS